MSARWSLETRTYLRMAAYAAGLAVLYFVLGVYALVVVLALTLGFLWYAIRTLWVDVERYGLTLERRQAEMHDRLVSLERQHSRRHFQAPKGLGTH